MLPRPASIRSYGPSPHGQSGQRHKIDPERFRKPGGYPQAGLAGPPLVVRNGGLNDAHLAGDLFLRLAGTKPGLQQRGTQSRPLGIFVPWVSHDRLS